jgi:SOS-response transcriptional repressor LexA
MSLPKRLKAARESKGLTQEQVGDWFGISRAAVAQWEKEENGTQPEIDRLPTLAARLGTTVSHLLGDSLEEPTVTEYVTRHRLPVPIISYSDAARWCDSLSTMRKTGKEEMATSSVAVSERAFALIVHGEGMEPLVPDGYTIIVDPTLKPEHGNLVVATLPESPLAIFKQYVVDAGRQFLKSANPRYPMVEMTDGAKILGVVVEAKRRMI